MTEFIHDLPKIITLLGALFVCGSMIALGFVGICKLLSWSPVNITVNIYRTDKSDD